MRKPYAVSSHETFTHDSLDSLGYDWERIANPSIRPRPPSKVYLPQSTQDVIDTVKEAKSLGQHLTVRSKGHSSNDLVVVPHGNGMRRSERTLRYARLAPRTRWTRCSDCVG
jgi:FAD/FMN-containing dehydrogenase